jgi:hypothetical protein
MKDIIRFSSGAKNMIFRGRGRQQHNSFLKILSNLKIAMKIAGA